MMRKEYSCDLCHEKRPPETLTGLRFHDMHTFTLDDARSTDGTHICGMCLEQLSDQLKPKSAPSDRRAEHQRLDTMGFESEHGVYVRAVDYDALAADLAEERTHSEPDR